MVKSYYSTSEMTGPFLCFLVGFKPLCFLHPADISHSCIVKYFMLFSPMMHLISNHKFRGNKDITPSNQKTGVFLFQMVTLLHNYA